MRRLGGTKIEAAPCRAGRDYHGILAENSGEQESGNVGQTFLVEGLIYWRPMVGRRADQASSQSEGRFKGLGMDSSR